jgi:hypothetical protein
MGSRKKTVQKITAVALLAFILVASLAGTAGATLCSGSDETLILRQDHLHLTACHPAGTFSPTPDLRHDFFSASGENREKSCIDLSFGSLGPVTTLLRNLLPTGLPFPLTIPWQMGLATISDPGAVAGNHEMHPATSPIICLRTVVLLI